MTNPYSDLARALTELDDAMRKAASNMERDDACVKGLFDCVRCLRLAVVSLERIHGYRTIGEC